MRELRGTVDLSTKRFDPVKTRNESLAGVAQLAEQLTCNQQVLGSSPSVSSKVARLTTRIIAHEQDTDRNNLYKNNGPYGPVAQFWESNCLASNRSRVRSTSGPPKSF